SGRPLGKREPRAPTRCRGCRGESSNAIHAPRTSEPRHTATRAASRRTSAGRIASAATATERNGRSIGFSSRNHAVVKTAAGMSETARVLRSGSLVAGEGCGQIGAWVNDGDGNPDRLQAEELRLRFAGRIDVDERCTAPRERPLHEPVGERNV